MCSAWDQKIFNKSEGEDFGEIIKQKWFGIDDLTYYKVRIKVARPDLDVRIAV
jgi:hypothetical protein